MYKILVIDDEKSIVKGLVKVLESREELELQVYYAYTVREGLMKLYKFGGAIWEEK